MSSVFDKNLLPEFESIRDDDEEILWTEKPMFIPYILSGLGVKLFSIAIGIIWILAVKYGNFIENSESNSWLWMFGILPLVQGVYVVFHKLFSYSNTLYAYSNKRVMIRTGFIGTEFKTIDYDKISDIEVKVNIIERMFNVGTIQFFSGRTERDDDGIRKLYDRWEAIKNPYQIFKVVKQTSVDIKTDYNYPNALRPEINPGYKTKYERN